MKHDDIEIVNVDMDNVIYAIHIQRSLFPDSDGAYNFLESLVKTSEFEFWLIKKGSDYIGTAGIYTLPEDGESAWLGWFGVLPQYRRQGIGSLAIAHYEKIARERGFRYARLYTNRLNNERAKSFYRANGYVEENYDCDHDPGTEIEILSIFSKALQDKTPVTPWGNRTMHIDEQLRKERASEMFPPLENAEARERIIQTILRDGKI